MKIQDLRSQTAGDRTRFSARLCWEDRDRADDTLWYEWPSGLAADIAPAAAAALVAALPLAVVTGERRIAMDAPVCARLYDHARDAINLFCVWYPELTAPAMEFNCETSASARDSRRAALCLSGGVDSLAALVDNHRALEPGHRERFRDGVYVFGLNTYDFSNGVAIPERVAWYEAYRRQLQGLCDHSGLTLVPVASNIRSLYADWATWTRVGQAGALAAVAHAMPRRVHALTIAASGVGAFTWKAGTQAVLDPLYSSYALDVRSAHATMTRLEKVRLIAPHSPALAVLRVCLTMDIPEGGAINCGRCEKCLRTMLTLVACDALARTPTFPVADVVPGMLASLVLDVAPRADQYRTLIEPLRQRGRDDLARAVASKVTDFERSQHSPRKSLVQRLLRH